MTTFLDLAQTIQMALKALQMYTPAHPRSQAALEALSQGLGHWLQERPSLRIAASSGKVFLDGAPVEGTSLHLTALIRQLTERQVSGFVIQRGVTPEELLAVLNLLILKPARIEEQGGPAAVLARENLPHIQLSQIQYREVKEGSGGEDEHLAPAMAALPAESAQVESAPAPQDPAAAALAELAAVIRRWQEGLSSSLGAPPDSFTPRFPGERPPAHLGTLGELARSIGWGESFPGTPQLESLRGALLPMPGADLLSIVAGLPTLSPAPPSLRQGFAALSPELLGSAVADLLARGIPWEPIREAIAEILRFSSQRAALLEGLGLQLQARGMEAALTALNHQLEWEGHSTEEQLRLVREEHYVWELTLEQRLDFLRRLLEEGRLEDLLALLDQILAALTAEDAIQREAAARTLAGMSHWLREPGLPLEVEGPMVESLTAHFGWEPALHIHRAGSEALEQILVSFAARGELDHVRNLLEELASLCEFLAEKQPWREEALARLRERIARPDLLGLVVELLHALEPEKVLATMIPFFEFVGQPAAHYLVENLGEEPDRKRRARLVDVIRVLGDAAIPALREGLESPHWYLVRNTLNLLSDMGDASLLEPVLGCLQHADGRVRRSAVRAAWRLAGPDAEPNLLELLPRTDLETQVEILFALAQMKSLAATPVLAGLAADSKAPEKLRVKAADTLGQIGDPRAMPALLELVKRKGRMFFTHSEPLDLRLAAARATLALNDPQGVAALRKAIEDEPKGDARMALQRLLDLHAVQP